MFKKSPNNEVLVSALELLICIVSLESIHREPTGAHESTKGGWIDRVRLNCTRGDWAGGGGRSEGEDWRLQAKNV